MAKTIEILKVFFMGRFYPALVALIVTLGHISSLEFYLNILNVLLAVTALCVCDSIKPIFTVVISFPYQVTIEHSPGVPNYSDYYFTEWRVVVLFTLGALVILGLVYFVWRNGLLLKLNFKTSKLLLPSLILSVGFLLNGAFTKNYTLAGVAFGLSQTIVYLVLFLLFYLGTQGDEAEELFDYLIYISLVISFVLFLQFGELFLFGDVISDGKLNPDNINLGWATKNPLGSVFASLIPILLYGSTMKKHGFVYLASAFLCWLCALFTCSRNALVFGTLIFVLCFIILCFFGGERRRWFVFLFVFGVSVALVAVFFLGEHLAVLFQSFISLGFTNNGRFKLWGQAWKLFCQSPIFGMGFFSVIDPEVYVAVEFMPTFVHNTPLQLLASTGIVGFLAYSYYRIAVLKMALIRPNLKKVFLLMTVLTVALQSLLDAFVFFYYPMFLPIAALAVLCRVCDCEDNLINE